MLNSFLHLIPSSKETTANISYEAISAPLKYSVIILHICFSACFSIIHGVGGKPRDLRVVRVYLYTTNEG